MTVNKLNAEIPSIEIIASADVHIVHGVALADIRHGGEETRVASGRNEELHPFIQSLTTPRYNNTWLI